MTRRTVSDAAQASGWPVLAVAVPGGDGTFRQRLKNPFLQHQCGRHENKSAPLPSPDLSAGGFSK
jgi:hypothetical protein